MTYANIEAEQQLLGAVMMNGEALSLVGDVLRSEHFADHLHGRIYDLIRGRSAKGHLVDPVAICGVLENDEALKIVGGKRYILRIAEVSFNWRNARGFAQIIIEAAARRALDRISTEAQAALQGGAGAAEVKLGLLHALQSVTEGEGQESSYSLAQTMKEAVEQAVRSYQGEVSLLKTGVGALDKIIKGLAPGDFMLLGGATSMGKTSLALEIARNVSLVQGKAVAFASLEMDRQDLATRLASERSRVPYSELRDASSMSEANFRKWVEAGVSIGQEARLEIIPKHVRDIPGIHAAAKRAQSKMKGLDLVIVDYAQLVRDSGKGRYEQMTNVSIGHKTMAGMLECPVIGLVQLSRSIGDRDDKRPHLNDIKETGQFENDADQAVFAHRESYWLERQGPKVDKSGNITDATTADWKADLAASKNKMEVIVRKNRHGPIANAEVGFHDATGRFWDLGANEKARELDF